MNKSKKQLTKEQLKKIKLGVLTLCVGLGLLVVVVSQRSGDSTETEALVETTATPSEIPESTIEEIPPETEAVFVPSPYKLNLAYVFPEGVDESDPLNSYAGEIYKELMREDNEYIANIYDTSGVAPLSLAKRLGVSSERVMGKYNPSAGNQDPDNPGTWYIPTFKNVNVSFYDAEGKRVNEYSNVKEIMSMASVYTYAHDYLDVETFKKYCEELYDKSRRYTISIGKVYYDSGCINRSAKEEGEEAKKIEEELGKLKKQLAEETAEGSGTENSASFEESSPGDPAAESSGIEVKTGGEETGTSRYETLQESAVASGELSTDSFGTSAQGNAADSAAGTGNTAVSVQDTSRQESSQQESTLADAVKVNKGVVLSAAKMIRRASRLRNIDPFLKLTAYGAELSQDASSGGDAESQVTETAAAETEAAASEEVKEESSTAYESVSLVPALYDDSYKETLETRIPESTTSRFSEYKAGQGIDIINDVTAEDKGASDSDREDEDAVETAEASSEGENEDKEEEESSETEEGSTDESKEEKIILGTFTREELRNMDDATLYSLIEESLEARDAKEESNGETDVKSKNYCPGHVDLYVSVTIYGFEEDNGLRSVELEAEEAVREETDEARETEGSDKKESKGSQEESVEAGEAETEESEDADKAETLKATDSEILKSVWKGWTDEQKAYAERLIAQDWFKVYGLSISTIDPKNPLTDEEISRYLDGLPRDISKDRKRVIKFALESVGKIPYYWGGKAGSRDYEGNAFGSIVEADYRGRVLRGLDCSGWIHWVYWSSIGENLNGACSTSSLIGEGEKINRADLQPGDVVIRTGADSHVVMFLGWAENGKMIAIHENSGANNVSVNEVTASYPYYRKLIN